MRIWTQLGKYSDTFNIVHFTALLLQHSGRDSVE